jgi:hypothetical protein
VALHRAGTPGATTKDPNPRRIRLKVWCAGRDLNPHGISTTSPSNWRVCLFHHPRTDSGKPCVCAARDYLVFEAGATGGKPRALDAGAGAAGLLAGTACRFGITLDAAPEPKMLPVARCVEA